MAIPSDFALRPVSRFLMTLTHFDADGASRMVNVAGKTPSQREAIASAQVVMRPETLTCIADRTIAKGDVFEVARLAAIMAAKRTDEWIPLCHTIPLERVEIRFLLTSPTTVRIEAEVGTWGKTGVEMEALTAASVAALTIYDMCKGMDRAMQITSVQLESKSGGRSGTFQRTPESPGDG